MNRIEEAKTLTAPGGLIKVDIHTTTQLTQLLTLALPVLEAALAANPATSIGIALGDTLTPWQEKEEDDKS